MNVLKETKNIKKTQKKTDIKNKRHLTTTNIL